MIISRALLSVSDKTGIIELAEFLQEQNIEILSTGGTAQTLREAGLEVTDVSEITGFPEIMDGRVKTLHPKVHGAILADLNKDAHQNALNEHGIKPIGLVVLNLYPFQETIASGAGYSQCVEQIDIGGPAMLRAAAKNHAHVTIITDPADYVALKDSLKNGDNATTLEFRQRMAQKAYARTAAYDAAISRWMEQQIVSGESGAPPSFPTHFSYEGELQSILRYGENPHQKAALYVTNPVSGTVAGATQLQGKELSYNNLNDTEAAWALVQEFDEPCTAIIKHANPCGVALGKDLTDSFRKALACDPVSAYGGIIAVNRSLTSEFIEAMGKLFVEVIIAPEISADAAGLLATKKKNLRLLSAGNLAEKQQGWDIRPISGGFLLQESDARNLQMSEFKNVTDAEADEAQLADMQFAFRVCKHVKSNAIVLAKNGATIGIGAGQMSRVDSVFMASRKAKEAGLSTEGCVMASDAFFPFDDNVHLAAEAGIKAIIQPGGSIRDEEVINAANQHNIAMCLTGIRHFRH